MADSTNELTCFTSPEMPGAVWVCYPTVGHLPNGTTFDGSVLLLNPLSGHPEDPKVWNGIQIHVRMAAEWDAKGRRSRCAYPCAVVKRPMVGAVGVCLARGRTRLTKLQNDAFRAWIDYLATQWPEWSESSKAETEWVSSSDST